MDNAVGTNIIRNAKGQKSVSGDWFEAPLPDNVLIDETVFIDTAYSFRRFGSERIDGFKLGYGSGSYGQSNFIGGKNSQIIIGNYVVLQGTNIISNGKIEIKDHSMFSWGSVVTDSWITEDLFNIDSRRKILIDSANTNNRNFEFSSPGKIIIEENVWVGFKAVILPGVTLGRGCVIASNCVIFEDVPPYAVVAGNPSRIIKYLDPEDNEEVKQEAIKNIIDSIR